MVFGNSRHYSANQPAWMGLHSFHGCWFFWQNHKQYLPQVQLKSHTTILSTTSRTSLTQTFSNPQKNSLNEVQYSFPLYDGVSVVSFRCTVGDRTITGIVKEKFEARTEYKEAVDRGETAGLLEQSPEAADVFTTKIGNVPAESKVVVEITYLGELKNDTETDGARFTIPTTIAPRYGSLSNDSLRLLSGPSAVNDGGISILVDVILDEGAAIRGIQSPSHPIAVTVGHTSTTVEDEDAFTSNHGSATLTLGKTELDKDFIIIVQGKGQDTPRALLEAHPTIANQRALMTTLVPKFNLPNIHPEIVFIVDRSGSMGGKMHLVIEALKVFLKSLPVGVKFNICSFGSHFDFLFKKSQTYDESSLNTAMKHLDPASFSSNYGGTEMLKPVQATVKQRFKDLPLEVMLLTDGEIWNQQEMFDFINESSKKNTRYFTLGVGSGASSALVEGIARAGNGFSQWVDDGEKIDKRIVRMLKGALTPHITDYHLEVKYDPTDAMTDDDFELVESFEKSMTNVYTENTENTEKTEKQGMAAKFKNPISLFNKSEKDQPTNPPAGRYDHLPAIEIPKVLQAPHHIPGIYPHERTTVYLLLGPESNQLKPKSVVLRGTSEAGPLELEIPVQDVGTGETIHQMAAKKAIHELEQGRGWVVAAKNKKNNLLKSKHEGKWDMIVEREAVRLGVQFQVGGKHCSFVAVEQQKSGEDKILQEQSFPDDLREKSKDGAYTHQSRMRLSAAPAGQPPAYSPMLARNALPRGGAPFGASQQQGVPISFGGPPAPSGAPAGLFGSANDKSMATKSKRPSFGGGLFGGFGSSSATAAPPPPPAQAQASHSVTPMSSSLFGAAPPAPARDRDRERRRKSSQSAVVKKKESYAAEMESAACMALPDEDESLDDGLFEKMEHLDARNSAFAEGGLGPQSNIGSVSKMSSEDKMHKLIEQQTFSGSWKVTELLLQILGLSSAKNLLNHNVFKDIVADDEVKATCAAVAWLEVHAAQDKDVFEMVAEKARNWVSGKGVDADALVARAKKIW